VAGSHGGRGHRVEENGQENRFVGFPRFEELRFEGFVEFLRFAGFERRRFDKFEGCGFERFERLETFDRFEGSRFARFVRFAAQRFEGSVTFERGTHLQNPTKIHRGQPLMYRPT
jgi:hypothetical protein